MRCGPFMSPEKNMPLFVIFGWQLTVIQAKLLGVILAIELANQLVNYGKVFQPFIVNVLLLILIFGTLTKKLFRATVKCLQQRYANEQLGRKLDKQIILSG